MTTDTIWLIITVALVGGVFAWLWRGGYLARFATYVAQTKEELRKCTWPTWDELKGSTVLISVAIVLLGVFTVAVDFVFSLVVRYIT
jgi:preprotein translocase subunit SecE